MSDFLVRARIRELVKAGVVPCDEPEKVWAGHGTGSHCLACGAPVVGTEIEYEVSLDGRTFRVHRPCFVIWREECDAAVT